MKHKKLRNILALAFMLLLVSFKEDDKVLICLSSGATKYHSHYCQGLKKCTHEVQKITKANAIKKGYTACGYCY